VFYFTACDLTFLRKCTAWTHGCRLAAAPRSSVGWQFLTAGLGFTYLYAAINQHMTAVRTYNDEISNIPDGQTVITVSRWWHGLPSIPTQSNGYWCM